MDGVELVAIVSAIIAAAVTITTAVLSFRTSSRRQLSEDEAQLRQMLQEELRRCIEEKRALEQRIADE